ncbi:MAG TPA: type II secretion system secretin GspD [Stellaceae bacterium]|nr:type II secretion system secretin GspD [Stellaceae bacterium]
MSERAWRWPVIALAVAVAACNDQSSLNTQQLASEAVGPLAAASTTPTLLPSAPSPGRAVATVPASRGSSAIQPIVVRGSDSPAAGASKAAGGAASPADVTLNFAGADIRDVVHAVLGETLKLNYVIDPEVQGPVTFNVSRPISRDEVLTTLEAVLNSRGATMVQSDGVIRVMPLRKDGKSNAAPPLAASAPGQRTEIFPLRFVSATDMQRVLEKTLPAGTPITGDNARRMVLIQGTPSELQLAEDTVKVFDIDQLSGASIAVVPLRNADPAALADELRNIFAATRKEADSDAIRIMAVKRLNAIMVITRAPRYLDEARAWIQRLDRAHDLTERRVYVYNLQYAKAAQIGEKLQGLLTNLDIKFKPSSAPATDTGLAPTAPGFEGPAKPLPPPLLPTAAPAPPAPPLPAPAPAPDAAAVPAVPPPPETGVRIEADEAHNALLISANARDYELIRQVLAGIDVPPLQVLIEVTVAEVVLNDTLNYGVEYYINHGKTNTLLTTSNVPAISPVVPGFNLSWVAGNFQPKIILDMLSSITQTKVISTPRLLVLSNETARLQVGDVVPIITQSAASTVTSNPLVLNNVTYKETGVVLEVTPRINAGGYVTMDLNQSVSTVVPTSSSQIDSPTFQQRRLNSTVSVKSGETILLGGLIQQTDSRQQQGIPILHDIPGIGSLFGSHNNGAARTELIMLMTPHVISNEADSRGLTAQIEQQFQTVLDNSTFAHPRTPSR